jgi:hypothetical protein
LKTIQGVQKLMGENPTIVRAEFSTLSLTVSVKSETVWTYGHAHYLELKT